MKRTSALLAILVVLWAVPATGEELPVDGVIGLHPAGQHVCLAVEVDTGGQALHGLRWFHNDASVAFPKLLLLEGQPGAAPNLDDTGLILQEIQGESLAWGEVTLDPAVTSTTGVIQLVFLFPSDQERTGEGAGGGPGLGYRHRPDARPAYISPDGQTWDRVHRDWDIAIDPVLGMGKGEAAVLADLVADLQGGDWDWRSDGPAEEDGEAHDTVAAPTRPMEIVPNPFNPQTEVRFALDQPSEVDLAVYDARGRRVRTLLSGMQATGVHAVSWQGVDDTGRAVASGVYFVRLKTAKEERRIRAVLVR